MVGHPTVFGPRTENFYVKILKEPYGGVQRSNWLPKVTQHQQIGIVLSIDTRCTFYHCALCSSSRKAQSADTTQLPMDVIPTRLSWDTKSVYLTAWGQGHRTIIVVVCRHYQYPVDLKTSCWSSFCTTIGESRSYIYRILQPQKDFICTLFPSSRIEPCVTCKNSITVGNHNPLGF